LSARRLDAVIAAALFCVATWVGVRAVGAFRDAGGVPDFYQRRFGPAVALACGRPFAEPVGAAVPALAAFLAERTESFDCGALPDTLASGPLDAFQSTSRYLLYAAALTWRMAGVSWRALSIVAGLLFGAVAALTYGVLRLALSRAVALLAFVPAITSTPNVMLVPQLRDYAKGPFLLAVILIMGWLVLGSGDRRRVIGFAAAAGVVIGIGLGFRTDLMIAVVPVLVTLALLVPASTSLRTRAAAAAVFLATFVVAGWPILTSYAKGGNTGHVALLGLGTPFDGPLRVEPSIYEFAGQYNDSLAYSIINSYALRVEHRRVILGSAEYEEAARAYLTAIARVFPADLITRGLAAVRAVPHYFLDTSLFAPLQADRPLRAFYRVRASVLWRLAPFAFGAVVAAVLIASVVHPRAAALACLVLVGFAGISALQFHERHFFYLQFVPWLAFGFLVDAAIAARRGWTPPPRRVIVRALAIDATLVALLALAVWASRAYQQRAAADLFARYEAAARIDEAALRRPVADRILVSAPSWNAPLAPGARWVEARFVAVRFRGDVCGGASLPIVVRYSGDPPDVDLSEPLTVHIARASAPTTLYVAAYDRADESIRFRGIEVPTARANCVGGLADVQGLASTPLLLTTQLAPGWRGEQLFERLR